MSGLSGFADLDRRLAALSGDIATKIGQSANRAGAVVVAEAVRREAPVGPDAEGSVRNRKAKSGRTRQEKHNKIVNHVRVKKVRAQAGTVENAVAIDAYHASMVEFGSIHNAPNPFMMRALAGSEDAAIDKMGATLSRRLNKAGV